MGLFTGLLLLPLAPLRGTIWLAEQLAEIADLELNDESTVVRLLLEAEIALEAGEISLSEYEEIEDELLRGGLVPVASGIGRHDGASAIRIRNRHAALHAGRAEETSDRVSEADLLRLAGLHVRGAATSRGRSGRRCGR